ncbi:CHAT domain-containing protein [Streptomyces geranii]|uniref:CHAT domain-containing protein n=1 Tax=Streptomyces geranii TaxID=2058923 RepID=UPI000D03DFDE|nr:CHAT domain-containing protein [Streptomyces geranii]
MGFFTARREAEYERVQQAIAVLQARGQREGTAAVVDDSWKLMRQCFDKMALGKTWYAPLVLTSSRVSFGMHADLGQWFFAACSSLSFGTGVVALDALCTKRGLPFPEELHPDIQLMADLAPSVAHRAGVPLAGYLVAESLTGLRMGDRTIARELSAYLGSEDSLRRLRAIHRDMKETAKQARRSLSDTTSVDTVAALRAQADEMMIGDLDATLTAFSKGNILSGAQTVSAVLGASKVARSVIYVAPGPGFGTAIRLEAPETGRELCESVELPGLGLEAVRDLLKKLRAVLESDERRKTVRDNAVREAHAAVGDALWKPLLTAWPELAGGRVALVPLGESALLPLYTAPVDGVPVCGLIDLTVVPSGNALMFASAWPRPSQIEPLVVADPWYHDGVGGVPIPFTVSEARQVAAVHGVSPVILRGQEESVNEDSTDRLRGLLWSPASSGSTGPVPQDLARQMSAANLVHLAGHGLLDAVNPLESAVLLGRPLPLSALLEHDLRRGATVVLSACHLAGIGTRLPGEQLGFPAALLAMGASSVIAALWSVPDSPQTVQLMSTFHEELTRGAPPSAALGTAVAHAASSGARPTVWGPFTHFGA